MCVCTQCLKVVCRTFNKMSSQVRHCQAFSIATNCWPVGSDTGAPVHHCMGTCRHGIAQRTVQESIEQIVGSFDVIV